MIILLNIFAIAFENYFIFKMLCNFKNIKDKKWKLYFGLFIIYFISLLIVILLKKISVVRKVLS